MSCMSVQLPRVAAGQGVRNAGIRCRRALVPAGSRALSRVAYQERKKEGDGKDGKPTADYGSRSNEQEVLMDLVEHGLLDQQQQNHAMPVEVVESSPKDRSGATTTAALPEDVMPCPNIRHLLAPRPSPFVVHNNYGGGFVHDNDLVTLQALKFASQPAQTRPAPAAPAPAPTPAPAPADGSNPTSPLSSTAADMVALDLSIQRQVRSADTRLPERAASQKVLPAWAVRAGARETIFYDPGEVRAAILICGSLCPGLNDVVCGMVRKLEDYGVRDGNILGVRYGLRGLYAKGSPKPIALNSSMVDQVLREGGTILGTSVGTVDINEVVKRIDMLGINMLFVIGGEGGHMSAYEIQLAMQDNDVPCTVVGVPKSIENDILLIDRTFGFDTAVEEAQRALYAAKTEAFSAYRGIGIVKLMGRQSGFIAMQAALASGVVDVCLVPEVPFIVDGPDGLYAYIEEVLEKKGHAVICVAEGAGQDLIPTERDVPQDEFGRPLLKDVGAFLKKGIKKHFKGDCDIKFIDPATMIRAIPTTSGDRIYCKILAHNAVHGAFAGYTGVSVGLVNTHYVYLPFPVIVATSRRVDPRGKMWNRLRHAIGQPNFVPGGDLERHLKQIEAQRATRLQTLSPHPAIREHREHLQDDWAYTNQA